MNTKPSLRRRAVVAGASALCVFSVAAFPSRAGAATAARQSQSAPAAEPATTSHLTGRALPDGALRVTENALAGELTELLKSMATESGFALGQTEALLWGGSDHDAGRNKTLQNALTQAMQKAGYNYQVAGEKDIQNGRATLFLAGKTGAKQAMLGFFVANEGFFVLAWGRVTPKNSAADASAESPSARTASSDPPAPARPAQTSSSGKVPADLLGKTWSWTTISGVGYRDTITKQLAEPSGMSVRFTFTPDGRYDYFWYMRQRTFSLVTEATSTHQGKVTFNGDGTFTLHPTKGHYKGSTGSKIVDRPMTEDEKRKPMTFAYEWRTEDGKRQLYIGPSKSSLSRFKPAE